MGTDAQVMLKGFACLRHSMKSFWAPDSSATAEDVLARLQKNTVVIADREADRRNSDDDEEYERARWSISNRHCDR